MAAATPAATITAERLRAQLLAGAPARDPLAVTQRLLAVQGQDARGFRLAIRARSSGLRAADVDAALSDGALLVTWLNRGTLHLVCSEDYAWLHSLTAPRLLTGNARRLQQEGVTPDAADRAVRTIQRALSADGPLTRPQLKQRIDAAGVRTEGQALVHLLMLATLRGVAVRGPMIGSEHAYAPVATWLKTQRRFTRERALAELARRYMQGHAPADARDLARWSGLALGDARAGLAAIASELRERPDGLLEPARRRRAPAQQAPPRLLGAFDPLLLGWCSREPIVGRNESLVTVNGLFRPFALARGRAVARWTIAAREVELEPFERLTRADAAALREDADDVLRYLAIAPASARRS
ncbi:MAG TPA: winged helix DNA-binding domain-containing protein [Solirubrobacteraceae bacterium]|nr:winged helix DNA-binding domain-containing protein [Solirubrobacteraceae bacterium]